MSGRSNKYEDVHTINIFSPSKMNQGWEAKEGWDYSLGNEYLFSSCHLHGYEYSIQFEMLDTNYG